MKVFTAITGIAASVVAFGAQAAIGDTATYTFDLPSTAVASQNPPYPSVATLMLTEVADGVEFVLTPNWSDPSAGFSVASRIDYLDYVYKGALPTFTFLGGAPIESWSYETNPNNMDSGYKTDDQHLKINWFSGRNDDRFTDPETSSWKFSGVLTDFTGTQATSGPKPSPIFGVISVTAYSLEDPKPTPSNWVAGVTPIPEPGTWALMLGGLLGVGFMSRRRQR